MKNLKVILSLAICLAMVLSFTACSGETTTSSEEWEEWEEVVSADATTNSDGASNSDETSNDSQGVSASTSDAFINSLKGLEVNIYTYRSERPTRGTASGDRYFAILSKVAKKYGCTINYKTEGMEGLQSSILSGKPLANVISIQDYNFMSWLNSGVAADLTKAMSDTGITLKEKHYNSEITNLFNLNGKQYAFSSDIYEPFMLLYNKRLIQEAGITDPITLYEQGNWNFAKLEEYLKKLRTTSADGTEIVAGLKSTAMDPIAEYIVTSNGGSFVKLENGKIKSNLNDSKVKEALGYLSKWSNESLISGAGSNWKDGMKDFAAAKASMVLITKYGLDVLGEYNMKDAVGMVPFPYGPSATDKKGTTYMQFFPTIIPKSEEKNASKILFVMNEVYKECYAVREDDFYDNYRALIRDNASYNIFKSYSLGEKAPKMSYSYIAGILWGDYTGLSSLIRKVSGGTAVETAINSYSDSITTGLNDQWAKWSVTGK